MLCFEREYNAKYMLIFRQMVRYDNIIRYALVLYRNECIVLSL